MQLEKRTISSVLADIQSGAITPEQGAREMGPDSYAAEYYDCTVDEVDAWELFRDAYKTMMAEIKSARLKPTPIPVEMVRCSCGHTISKNLVMTTSMGSSCPRCYDRMSE